MLSADDWELTPEQRLVLIEAQVRENITRLTNIHIQIMRVQRDLQRQLETKTSNNKLEWPIVKL